jgi:uncharacterized protein YkwD
MVKRLMIVTALTALILSACSALGQDPTATLAPTNTVTPVLIPTQAIATESPATEPPAATDGTVAPTEALATISATADVLRPTNAPDCTNSASFVADVTIPDNTEVAGGTTFVKTWRIANTGTCIWGPDYTLSHYSDERMGAPASITLGVTYPGQTLDISLSLTAPNSIGSHRANFVIKNPKGLIMKVNEDSRLWLIIQVKNTAAATAAPTTNAPTATQGAAVLPTNTTASTTSGNGFANVTCSFSIDQGKMLQVINAVNAYRSQKNLPNYTVNAQLAQAAQAHASDMACNNLNSHTGSNSSTVKSRVAASGYVAAFQTENVYFSNPPVTGQDAVNWWINDQTDPKHNLNLISDTYIDIGVGYAFFNNTGYYVIVFGTP